MDDYVSFEVAKKLKDNGFSCFCSHYYKINSKDLFLMKIGVMVNAPTIPQVLKWLREKKEVDLVIEPIYFFDKNKYREYNVRVFTPPLNKPVHCGYFKTWEKAALAGIEYVLNNLI